jgi:hypothetical protein
MGIMCTCRATRLPADCSFSELAPKSPTKSNGLVH